MNTEQKIIIAKSYDWVADVVATQKKIISNRDFWIAYPFKKNGLTKEGLFLLIETMKNILK
jgi:hypothetical protein